MERGKEERARKEEKESAMMIDSGKSRFRVCGVSLVPNSGCRLNYVNFA